MVVLNMFGKIEPICISEKMKLYISNLPNNSENDWNSYVVKEFKFALKLQELNSKIVEVENRQDVKSMYEQRVHNDMYEKDKSEDELIQEMVDNMICIYFDYSYDDMPMGGWDENPFDGRFCEKDYTEILIDFFYFMSKGTEGKVPTWIYSSNYDFEWPYYRMFWHSDDLESQINCLKSFGNKLDSFLQSRNEYLQIDYIARALHEATQYDTYHYFKLYSLCQLFLENKNESELDYKLPLFLDEGFTEAERRKIASILRQMRNKIAHGDFIAFEQKVEEYARFVMDGRYNFDYSEYSRKNWAILNVCCLLSEAIRKMIHLMFEDQQKLQTIKLS